MIEHKHSWKRISRKHKRPGRFFVQCTDPDCRLIQQAVIRYRHLHVFHTGVKKGGKSKVVSYRLKEWQKDILEDSQMSFVEFVDNSFAAYSLRSKRVYP